MNISLIIPVLNEEDNLQPLHHQVTAILLPLANEYEIIFVDDGSSDASLQRMTELQQTDSHVKVLSLSRNFGHQMALTAGMDNASGDACILMDADLQHPPEIIKDLVSNWQNGYDIVYTIRQTTADAGYFKRLSERVFYVLFRRLSGIDLPAHTADFRLLDRHVVDAFQGLRERARFLRGLTRWVGFRSIGVSYSAPSRRSGMPKYSFLRSLKLALDGVTSFTAFPLYVSIYVGMLLTLLGLLYVPYAIYVRFVTHHAVPGWASLITVICFIGGIQLLLAGVQGIYIAKIYEEVKQRPLYLIRKTLGFDKKK